MVTVPDMTGLARGPWQDGAQAAAGRGAPSPQRLTPHPALPTAQSGLPRRSPCRRSLFRQLEAPELARDLALGSL